MTWSRFFDAYEPMHAFVAEVIHPVTGKMLRLEAPLAEDLQECLMGLNTDSSG